MASVSQVRENFLWSAFCAHCEMFSSVLKSLELTGRYLESIKYSPDLDGHDASDPQKSIELSLSHNLFPVSGIVLCMF